jgi:hypothetical protein
LRFAVRRPATRPASPRGHRPPGGDALALRAGPSRQLTDRDASPAERPGDTDVRGLTPPDRASLARVLMGPAGADLDLPGPAAGSWDRGSVPVGVGSERAALAGVVAGVADGPWARDGLAPGPVAGPPASAAARSDLDVPGPAGRSWDRGSVPVGVGSERAALAAVVAGVADEPRARDGLASGPVAGLPAFAAARPDLDVTGPAARSWDRGSAPVGVGSGRAALAGVVAGSVDEAWAWDGLVSGPVAGPPGSAEARTTDIGLAAPGGHVRVAAGEDPEVFTPTRVMAGRPPARSSGETVHHLGETTDGLLLRHLRTRAAKDALRPASPPGLNRPARLSMTVRPAVAAVPSTITEIPRRERRLLPGRKAGDSTPRTR